MTFSAGRIGKWVTLALWIVAAMLLAPLAAQLTGAQKNDASAWLPRSAEATKAYDQAKAAFPGSDALVAVVVYARDGGLTDADRAKVAEDQRAVATWARDRKVSPVVVSGDSAAALYSLALDADPNDQAGASAKMTEIRDVIQARAPDGLRSELTGPAAAVTDLVDAFGGLDTTLLLVTIAVVAVILLLTYRSPVLWLVPLFSVALASQLANAIVYLLAKNAGVVVNGQAAAILTVLVFGAGTDYAMLLIARYREELRRHEDRHEAMRIAVRRSFPAVLASGATVSLGLLCLLAAQMNSTRALGPVGAVGIVAALVAMTTLLPALLVIFGRWLFWPVKPRYSAAMIGHDVIEDHGVWGKVARMVGRRPTFTWIGTAVALGALAVATFGLHTGLRQSEQYTSKVGSVSGQELVDAHFPAGSSAPATVLTRAGQADAVAAAARGVSGVTTVNPPTRSPDGEWATVGVVLESAPDSPAAEATVERLRTAVHAVDGADALVGGTTATLLDTKTATQRDLRVVMPLILAVVLLVLIPLLRALVAPLLLIASVVLSFFAAMGAATLIFKAIGYPRIDQGTILPAFLFLVALGVDYTIFLMTRTREEVGRIGHRDGVLYGLAVTGGVITSAGLVLAATFSVLTVVPLVSMLHLGIIVAVGVLLDTFVVRSLLVPALSLSVGRRIWWPSRLASKSAAQPGRLASVTTPDRETSRVG